MTNEIFPIQNIIHITRNQKVILDADLAKLYGVETFNLNKAVKPNITRFPLDFMFQITKEENESLIFQYGISKPKRGGNRYLPYAFTEQGVAMLSSVLKSEQAININIQIMRTFVQMKQLALSHQDLKTRLDNLESYFIQYSKDNDQQINQINEAINYLIDLTKPAKIGFKQE